MRNKLIVGNWKMNGDLLTNQILVADLLVKLASLNLRAEVALCAPFVYLLQLKQLVLNSAIKLGAQDVSAHTNGAFTGEISAAMLADLAVSYALVGHSERRNYHAEDDALVGAKAIALLKQGIRPIICVGETLAQRQQQQTQAVIEQQIVTVFEQVCRFNRDLLVQCTVAYEPVWAIGTGVTATPEQAQQAHEWIRNAIKTNNQEAGAQVRILYGGSMNASNAKQLLEQADIDGGLIGGASLQAKDFATIISLVN